MRLRDVRLVHAVRIPGTPGKMATHLRGDECEVNADPEHGLVRLRGGTETFITPWANVADAVEVQSPPPIPAPQPKQGKQR